MATISMHDNEIETCGRLPEVGTLAPDFTLTAADLSNKQLSDYKGKNIILNVFPSSDTPVCANSIRQFNKEAAGLNNTVVLCISKDLPFAQKRFCESEGIENVEVLSDFRTDFGEQYGVQMINGSLRKLLSRAVIIINPVGKIIYTEQVPNIGDEPNYQTALSSLQ